MAKTKRVPKLEDYVHLSEEIYTAAGNLVGGTIIAKELAPIFFQNMYEFDKDSLKSYRDEDWYFMYFLYIMGVATGEKNAEDIRGLVTLIEAKRPIRLQ